MNLDAIDPKQAIVALLITLTTIAGAGAPALANGTASGRYDRSKQSQNEYEYYEEGEFDEDDQRFQQTTTGLTQRSDLIGACRYSPNRLDVFAEAGQTERLLTIAPDTPVTLTGVVGTGIAEIRYPADGWISTLTLESCVDEDDPDPFPPPEQDACYRTLTNVTVRTAPSVNARSLGYIRTGGIAYPTTHPPNEAISSDGRTWIEIDGFLGDDGWIAITGVNGTGSNVEGLPDQECERD